jgi:hypothetical protein
LVVPEIVAVPSILPVKLYPFGSVPLSAIFGSGVPLTLSRSLLKFSGGHS